MEVRVKEKVVRSTLLNKIFTFRQSLVCINARVFIRIKESKTP